MTKEMIFTAYAEKFTSSQSLFSDFLKIFPRGVCHDIRNFPPFPFITESAEGTYLIDVDGHRIMDLWMGHYANILGHSHPEITAALNRVLEKGGHTGTANIYQLKLAKALQSAVPGLEQLRFCSSGTEATMYALRVARAYTGKDLIVKIQGGWHGGNSDLSHSVKKPFHEPSTEGLNTFPPTVSIPINDIPMSTQILASCGDKVAAIIMEPVLGAGGGIKADSDFVQMLRDYCDSSGAILVFDETITAFRFRYGSIAEQFGIQPDLYTMGKIIGGGLHVGMYGGKADIMRTIEEKQLIVGGGTFSANPLSMTAGTVMLDLLKSVDYTQLNATGDDLVQTVKSMTAEMNGVSVTGFHSLFALHFENVEDENLFRIMMLLENVFTMHGGGAIGFSHLENGCIDHIKQIYQRVLANEIWR